MAFINAMEYTGLSLAAYAARFYIQFNGKKTRSAPCTLVMINKIHNKAVNVPLRCFRASAAAQLQPITAL